LHATLLAVAVVTELITTSHSCMECHWISASLVYCCYCYSLFVGVSAGWAQSPAGTFWNFEMVFFQSLMLFLTRSQQCWSIKWTAVNLYHAT